MSDIQIIQELVQLPITVILAGVVVFLWRKYEKLQQKYEDVLIEVGKLKGKVDVEMQIEKKLEDIYSILEHNAERR